MERWPDDWSIPEGQELKDFAEEDPDDFFGLFSKEIESIRGQS